jgi:putative transposase
LPKATILRNLVPCFTPVRSPQSNGIAEAFVKTFKRDYVRLNARPNATALLAELDRCAHSASSSGQHQPATCPV